MIKNIQLISDSSELGQSGHNLHPLYGGVFIYRIAEYDE